MKRERRRGGGGGGDVGCEWERTRALEIIMRICVKQREDEARKRESERET